MILSSGSIGSPLISLSPAFFFPPLPGGGVKKSGLGPCQQTSSFHTHKSQESSQARNSPFFGGIVFSLFVVCVCSTFLLLPSCFPFFGPTLTRGFCGPGGDFYFCFSNTCMRKDAGKRKAPVSTASKPKSRSARPTHRTVRVSPGTLGIDLCELDDGRVAVWRVHSWSPLSGFISRGNILVAIDGVRVGRHQLAAVKGLLTTRDTGMHLSFLGMY